MFFLLLFESFLNAFRGIWQSIKRERNFRIHIVAMLYISVFAFIYGMDKAEWAILIVTMAFVLSTELMNTAVEESIDFKSKKRNVHAGLAKDTAASAVLVSAIAAVLVAVFLFSDMDRLSGAVAVICKFPINILLPLSLLPAILFVLGFRKYAKKV